MISKEMIKNLILILIPSLCSIAASTYWMHAMQSQQGNNEFKVSTNTNLYQEYLTAQIQRLIAENNEAIALAKRNAAQAMKETLAITTPIINSNKSSHSCFGYELVFTGQQSSGALTASLKRNGKILDVKLGDVIPDGVKVVRIDEAGVSLQRGNIKDLLTFNGEFGTINSPING